MKRHFFISYSTVDAQQFAIQLHDELEDGHPKYEAWLDKRDLRPGEDWDTQIDNAIRDCGAMLFVMTPDSVMDNSVCKLEWSRALSYKKSVILILLKECVTPFRLQNRQYIDFQEFSTGIAQLRQHLEWIDSPAGELQRMKEELMDAQRQLSRAPESEEDRIQKAIKQLEERITAQQFVVDNPEEAAERTKKSVEASIQQALQPVNKPKSGTKFINHPPATVPSYFRDRENETDALVNFLQNNQERIFHLEGRAGIGKTAIIVRLLKHLENGKLPDDNGEMSVDGIIYLSQVGSRDLKVDNLFPDLCRLLPDDVSAQLDALYREPKISTTDKMKTLLSHFPPDKRVLVLLDNFEDVVDTQTQIITDSELDEALKALVDTPPHGVKVLITTRILANKLYLHQTQNQRQQVIGEGLPSPYAEEMLREMDDGTLHLKNTPLETLSVVVDKVRRFPRALEALVGWLEVDFNASLDEVLKFAEGTLPENVVEVLVEHAFKRLDRSAQQVIQALAIYGRPVSSGAIDALLTPYTTGINSSPILRKLLRWHFVRQEGGFYALHPVDRIYALSLISRGEDSDRFERGSPVFTEIALYDLGADYFRSLRKSRDKWKTIKDLESQLTEFDLRCNAGNWDTAAHILTDIDEEYLILWGYYKLIIELHERLQGNLIDEKLKQISSGNLGTAYLSVGDTQKAVSSYIQAITIARKLNDRHREGSYLGSLGMTYLALGEVDKSIDYFQQAHTIASEVSHKVRESAWLGNLGNAYYALGEMDKAISYWQQALTISHEINNRVYEGAWLGDLGLVYATLGEADKAIDYLQQAIANAREINYKRNEALWLTNLGDTMVDIGSLESAVEHFEDALEIADEISLYRIQQWARWSLALSQLYRNELKSAETTIKASLNYDRPDNNHNAHVAQGIIALKQESLLQARESFKNALSACKNLLAKTSQLYNVKDAKGLALCGLALLDNDPSKVEEAKTVFREVRSYTSDLKGHIRHVQRQFDALAVVDEGGLLAGVREVIGGE